jgi:hypothetical protein
MTFDDVCSCLVAPYRWSIVGQERWLPGIGFPHELEVNEERAPEPRLEQISDEHSERGGLAILAIAGSILAFGMHKLFHSESVENNDE